LHVVGAAREVGHEEGGPDQVALAVAQLDASELGAGLAGGVGVLHAITPADLGWEQLGRRLDLLIEEPAEALGVARGLLILLR
jgi:hypothetical protein